MRVAIVGYGRMGHEVEAALASRGHEVCLISDPAAEQLRGPAGIPLVSRVESAALSGCDVAIEFSLASGVMENVREYAAAGIAAVIGTTGWLERLDDIRTIVDSASIGAVYGSNFSVGAHVFFRAAEQTVALVRDLDEYDLFIREVHHRGKKDSPSGTALSLAEAVMRQVPRKRRIETDRLDRAPEPDELHVSSARGGSEPGLHALTLDSAADTIEISHRARNRGGFALGAVRAAEWIVGRKGLFPVERFIDELISRK